MKASAYLHSNVAMLVEQWVTHEFAFNFAYYNKHPKLILYSVISIALF